MRDISARELKGHNKLRADLNEKRRGKTSFFSGSSNFVIYLTIRVSWLKIKVSVDTAKEA